MIDWLGSFWKWLGDTNPDAWAAGAAWFAAVIAVVAGRAAFKAVAEARALREEQAQPYVVAYMEQSRASEQILELVVKNFGATAAYDVRLLSDPPLVRSGRQGEGTEPVGVFDCLPVLAPQQEWRTFWDSAISRQDLDIPDRFEVTATYADSRRRKLEPTKAILDWKIYDEAQFVATYGEHHAAKALTEIAKVIKTFAEGGSGGVRVYTRDGDAKDSRMATRREEQMRKAAEISARVLLPKESTASPVPTQPVEIEAADHPNGEVRRQPESPPTN
jgi:hypothetical protein